MGDWSDWDRDSVLSLGPTRSSYFSKEEDVLGRD